MGYAHMYHNSDLHAGTLFDSQDDKYLQLYCYGATRPMLESNLDPKKNPVPLDGYPNIYVPRNFDEAPCGYGTIMVYPELIIENDVLLDQAWKEVKANTTNLIKIDFIEILENAGMKITIVIHMCITHIKTASHFIRHVFFKVFILQ